MCYNVLLPHPCLLGFPILKNCLKNRLISQFGSWVHCAPYHGQSWGVAFSKPSMSNWDWWLNDLWGFLWTWTITVFLVWVLMPNHQSGLWLPGVQSKNAFEDANDTWFSEQWMNAQGCRDVTQTCLCTFGSGDWVGTAGTLSLYTSVRAMVGQGGVDLNFLFLYLLL